MKVSVATALRQSRGGQFVAHVAALPGNPYDGHTLVTTIPAIQAIIGNTLDRVIADAGYRGRNASPGYQFKVYTTGQNRCTTPKIRRDMRRGAAVGPSSATSRKTTAWAAIVLPIQAAMPSTPCSPPSDTTSASCSGG